MQAYQLRLLILVSFALAVWHLPGFDKAGFAMAGGWDQMPDVQWDYPTEGLSVTGFPCRDSGRYVAVFSASATLENGAALELTANVDQQTCTDCRLLELPGTGTFVFEGPAGVYRIRLETSTSPANLHTVVFPLTLYPRVPLADAEACGDTLHVLLEEACQVKGYYNFVSNATPSCTVPSDFQLWVDDGLPGNKDTIDGVGLWAYLLKYRSDWEGLAGPLDPLRLQLHASDGVDFRWPRDAKTALTSLGTAYGSGSHTLAVGFEASGRLTLGWSLEGDVDLQAWVLDAKGQLNSLPLLTRPGGAALVFNFVAGDRLLVHTTLQRQTGTASPAVHWGDIKIVYTGVDANRSDEVLCRGMIRAEDKRLPLAVCPGEALRQGIRKDRWQAFSGDFAAGSSGILDANFGDCLPDYGDARTPRYFATYTFRPFASGNYDFLLRSDVEPGSASMIFYAGAFDPARVCDHLLGYYVDKGKGVPLLRFRLEADSTYVLLVAANDGLSLGSFEVEVRHGDGVLLPGLPQFAAERRVSLYAEDLSAVRDQPGSFGFLDMPVFSDNCGIADTIFKDELVSASDCGETLLRRYFRVVDNSGNYADCSFDVLFGRPDVAALLLPPSVFAVGCDQPVPLDAAGYVLPEWSGYPMLETLKGWVTLHNDYQNLAAVYQDSRQVVHCKGSFSYLRTWTLLDWCRPAALKTYTQTIKVGDFSAPSISIAPIGADTVTLEFSATNADCTAGFLLPMPLVEDACAGWWLEASVWTYVRRPVWNAFGEPIATLTDTLEIRHLPNLQERRFVSGLSVGRYEVRYTARDDCGNTSQKSVSLRISDREPPVAVCADALTVYINSGGEAVLFASEVDEGSLDFCQESVQFALRRRETAHWSEAVYFDCSDIGDTIEVTFQATDALGNGSICTVQVAVADNSRPECVPPRAVTVNVLDLPSGFVPEDTLQLQHLFGIPAGRDNCAFSWREKTPVVVLDICGAGTIRRYFEVADRNGNISAEPCEQVIQIEPGHHYAIKFPRDASFDCSSPGMADSLAVIDFKNCDLISVATQDKYSYSADQQCYLIFRTFEIINWCEYDGWGDPVIVSRDEDCDGISGEEDVWVMRTREQVFFDRDSDVHNQVPAAAEKKSTCHTASDQSGFWRSMDLAAANGFWSYTQLIEVNDTHAPEISFANPAPVCVYAGSACSVEIDYLFLVLDNCNPDGLVVSVSWDAYSDGTTDRELPVLDSTGIGIVSGAYPKFRIRDRMPIGRHTYIIAARDACGNGSQKKLVFEVLDCEAPAVKCIQGLATELMQAPYPAIDRNGDGRPDQAFSLIRVEDILTGSLYDCSPIARYSINKAGETPDPFATSVVVTCDDLPAVVVELYVWDDAFNPTRIQPDGTVGGPNYGTCETVVFVQDNLNNWCQTYDLEGNIQRPDGDPVADVQLSLNGYPAATTRSSREGTYRFAGLSPSYDYTILPAFAGDPVEGVTTFDLLTIAEHILGVATLDSPYQLIAADADNSGSITTLDLLVLRSLILRKIKTFPHQMSWRFIDASYEFRNPRFPWRENYPELINLSSTDESVRGDFDFVAVKIGDVVEGRQGLISGGDVPAVLRIAGWSDPDNSGNMGFYLDSDIPVRGLQFSLDYLGIATEELEITPGKLSGQEVFYERATGSIHVSAFGAPIEVGDEPLFELSGMDLKPEHFQLSTSGLAPECYYMSDGAWLNVPLAAAQKTSDRVRDVFPNPVQTQLAIPVVLKRYGKIIIEVYSSQGILLHREPHTLPAGNHTLIPQYNFATGNHSFYLVAVKTPGTTRVQKILSLTKMGLSSF